MRPRTKSRGRRQKADRRAGPRR